MRQEDHYEVKANLGNSISKTIKKTQHGGAGASLSSHTDTEEVDFYDFKASLVYIQSSSQVYIVRLCLRKKKINTFQF